MKEPTKELLKVVKDEKADDEKRSRDAYMYGLLMFAEPIDDKTVRITKETQEKLEMFVAFLRQIKEMNQ